MYDNVCRNLAILFSQDFARWLMGESIRLTELKSTELPLDPIRADSIIFFTIGKPNSPYRISNLSKRGYSV